MVATNRLAALRSARVRRTLGLSSSRRMCLRDSSSPIQKETSSRSALASVSADSPEGKGVVEGRTVTLRICTIQWLTVLCTSLRKASSERAAVRPTLSRSMLEEMEERAEASSPRRRQASRMRGWGLRTTWGMRPRTVRRHWPRATSSSRSLSSRVDRMRVDLRCCLVARDSPEAAGSSDGERAASAEESRPPSFFSSPSSWRASMALTAGTKQ
mmetsp:Transcript_30810/g.64363  ORF Transcript_30810/g.64363 Transcript_30810/m.64363 type:complete len:214 (+) Transcript_30810:330-971(+)